MPCAYAYATTMRRAQGATLDLVGLVFDHRVPDRGYAYVGASRARHRAGLYLVDRVRRTDWLPVGGNVDDEQLKPSVMSEDSASDDMETDSDHENAFCLEAESASEAEGGFGTGWTEQEEDEDPGTAAFEAFDGADVANCGWSTAPQSQHEDLGGLFA